MTYPRWKASLLLVTVAGLSIALIASKPIAGQDVKPASEDPLQTESADEEPVKVWTCSMHPRIHQHANGRCPICGMALLQVRRDALGAPMSLDQMLTAALQHNPDVRAARARLLASEAELDRTRLAVLQKIIAYRDRWSVQRGAIVAATEEVAAAQGLMDQVQPDRDQKRVARILANARRKLSFEQARLKEVEAELPFLLGRQNPVIDEESSDAETAVIKERLIPMVEQLIEVATEEYRKGQAEISEMTSWSQRLAELKVQTARTRTERIEIVQAHIVLLKTMQEMASARYKAGAASVKDVLAAQIQVAEAELWLAKVKGELR